LVVLPELLHKLLTGVLQLSVEQEYELMYWLGAAAIALAVSESTTV
jgi:hypothetical protein